MLTYTYTARNSSTGQKVKASVQADSVTEAAKLIRSQGFSPTDITLQGNNGLFKGTRSRVPAKERVIFARQLSTLINAGLPLIQSLNTVNGQTKHKALKVVIGEVIASVEGGKSLAESLEKHPRVFNKVFCSLVAAGETSGTLDKALERIAFQQEKDAQIIAKVRGAMAYPLIVLFVMFCVVTFMIVKVLPQVQEIYKGTPGVSLPILTRALLAVSHIITHYWWLVLAVIAFMVFFGSRYARTGPGKDIVDRMKMTTWPIGPLFMKLYMARFSRTGTTLVGSGVPLIQMLEITGDAVDNVHIKRSIDRAIEKVKGGKSLSSCLAGDPNFLDLVPQMIQIGEQSGALEDMLAKTADYFETEVDNQIRTLSTIMEPVLMIVMGVIAMIIVAAILLPIYSLVGHTVIK